MVARMSPLYELSVAALGTVMIIGAITAFFMGLLGIVQNDIKRVVAYSTLSQLGYMTVALGASAYSAAIFHLMTHAFFKALLFLAAGSVIIAMHHEQDIRRMGGVRKYMPITYWTSLIGSLALIGFPGTAGFFSKDLLIEAVGESHWAETDAAVYWIAYLSVLLGVFVTALYSFRMFFLVFHGRERMDEETRSHLHESPWVVTVPLVLLAIPSAVIGWFTVGPVLFDGFFGDAIVVHHEHDVLAHIGEHWHGATGLVAHALLTPVFWLAAAGVTAAWYLYLKRPELPALIRQRFGWLYDLLDRKYYFDDLWIRGFGGAGRRIGTFLWEKGDVTVIDGVLVNGTAGTVGRLAGVMRQLQTGYLYTYAFAMIIGLTAFLGWLIWVK
jgi:NADH-quinone oxidoreductase subunit L